MARPSREYSKQSFAQWFLSPQIASAPASKVVLSLRTVTRTESVKSSAGVKPSRVAACCCGPPKASLVQSAPAAAMTRRVPSRGVSAMPLPLVHSRVGRPGISSVTLCLPVVSEFGMVNYCQSRGGKPLPGSNGDWWVADLLMREVHPAALLPRPWSVELQPLLWSRSSPSRSTSRANSNSSWSPQP